MLRELSERVGSNLVEEE